MKKILNFINYFISESSVINKLETKGDLTEWDREWLRNAELSYSYTFDFKPLFLYGEMVGGYSWSDTDNGFDGIAFVEEYRGKKMLKKFIDTFSKNGEIKFITANDDLKSALSQYGDIEYDETDDSTTLKIKNK